MNNRIECPYCDGHALLQIQPRDPTYRKEVFKVAEHFYKCEICGEDFTTTETDTITLTQVHNQYREKHNILFPEEIVAIKEKYDLSATKMSEVLGLGVNGYSNYEKGEMPIPAIANLINTISKPEVFLELLEKAKDHFSEKSFAKAKNQVLNLIEQNKQFNSFHSTLNIYIDSNSFTGYKKVNAEKIANLITCFIGKSKPEFNNKLKLNKQLFYTDFRHYKNYGRSITGLSYRAIKYGPVPANYDSIYAHLENEQIISSNWIKTSTGSAVELFTSDAEFEDVLFTKEELETIETIVNQFRDTSSWDIVEISHKEKGWKELESERKLINYQEYAFDLIGA